MSIPFNMSKVCTLLSLHTTITIRPLWCLALISSAVLWLRSQLPTTLFYAFSAQIWSFLHHTWKAFTVAHMMKSKLLNIVFRHCLLSPASLSNFSCYHCKPVLCEPGMPITGPIPPFLALVFCLLCPSLLLIWPTPTHTPWLNSYVIYILKHL